MPRRPRGELRGAIHHVLNRGNNRQTVFHDDDDFIAFIRAFSESKVARPLRVYALTIMPNHFHAVLQPPDIDTMSRFMHRLQSRVTDAHHRRHDSSGHLWQGRYKAFPVQNDSHFLTVVRYVLQNPVRARLAGTPRDYPWTSLLYPDLVDTWPVEPPADFDAWLAEPLDDTQLKALRHSTNAQFPFGSTTWMSKTAAQLGIKLTPPRRPPKSGTGTP